jgi:hypothetical protein
MRSDTVSGFGPRTGIAAPWRQCITSFMRDVSTSFAALFEGLASCGCAPLTEWAASVSLAAGGGRPGRTDLVATRSACGAAARRAEVLRAVDPVFVPLIIISSPSCPAVAVRANRHEGDSTILAHLTTSLSEHGVRLVDRRSVKRTVHHALLGAGCHSAWTWSTTR